jgi:hypothetical protein
MSMIDYSADFPVILLIGVLVVLAFFVAIWPMDRY